VHPGETIGARKNRVNFKIDFFGKKKMEPEFSGGNSMINDLPSDSGGTFLTRKNGVNFKIIFFEKKN
jgi:hypothetical protein